MPRHESLCTYVVERQQVLAISDALTDPNLAKSVLVEQYGVRAYLGSPLFDADGHCLGALAVMDLSPRTFTIRDIQFLELMARWSMSEFERNRLLKAREIDRPVGHKHLSHPQYSNTPTPQQPNSNNDLPAINQVKLEILTQLTHELRTPLTSVLGMAGVVGREIYGPLTSKQKEYLEIIQHSGKYLLSIVNEISELGSLDMATPVLNPTAVDIDMLCQQVLNSLEEVANRREQEIRLSVEPGRSRTWVLDKYKFRQLLYHLVFSVIHSSPNQSVVRIHVSHRSGGLNLAVSVSHPWLGDGLIEVDSKSGQLPAPVVLGYPEVPSYNRSGQDQLSETPILPVADTQLLKLSPLNAAAGAASSGTLSLSGSGPLTALASDATERPNLRSREDLRLLLSCYVAQLHGGQISIQGTPESGYRYMVSLPELEAVDQSI